MDKAKILAEVLASLNQSKAEAQAEAAKQPEAFVVVQAGHFTPFRIKGSMISLVGPTLYAVASMREAAVAHRNLQAQFTAKGLGFLHVMRVADWAPQRVAALDSMAAELSA